MRRTLLAPGHTLELLEGSGDYFPAVIAALDAARKEAWLETYIFDFTGTGADVARALVRAAERGVQVRLVVDGFGTGTVPAEWQARFDAAGVQWRSYRPPGRFGLLAQRYWRRLHRKLCVVDAQVAFCGGINILDDFHDPSHGALEHPRFDFAVRVAGPLVAGIHAAMEQLWLRMQAVRSLKGAHLGDAADALIEAAETLIDEPAAAAQQGRTAKVDRAHTAKAALVLRDNFRNRGAIEREYRRAIAAARHEIIIANAYFVPGGKLRRALVLAARRGVRVQLLLQGRYEYFMQYHTARTVYGALLRAGVEIHEYSTSFLHAKVAVIDGQWSTVGSSNLDPLSLLMSREANVVIEGAEFAAQLRGRLLQAMQDEGVPMDAAQYSGRPWLQRAKEHVALALMRLALRLHGKRY